MNKDTKIISFISIILIIASLIVFFKEFLKILNTVPTDREIIYSLVSVIVFYAGLWGLQKMQAIEEARQ